MPERVLWNLLRSGRFVLDGEPVKFRRQHPVGPYVADFFCAEAALAVELDGGGHQRAHDERRDACFLALGIETLRLSVSDFEKHQESVLREIARRVRDRRARHGASESTEHQ